MSRGSALVLKLALALHVVVNYQRQQYNWSCMIIKITFHIIIVAESPNVQFCHFMVETKILTTLHEHATFCFWPALKHCATQPYNFCSVTLIHERRKQIHKFNRWWYHNKLHSRSIIRSKYFQLSSANVCILDANWCI